MQYRSDTLVPDEAAISRVRETAAAFPSRQRISVGQWPESFILLL